MLYFSNQKKSKREYKLVANLEEDLPDVLALGHVAEGILHLTPLKDGGTQRLDRSLLDALPQELRHLYPLTVALLKQGVQQDPVEGNIPQE